jgi:hypothetical protein
MDVRTRLPLAVTLLGCAILFAAIAFVFTLVVVSLVNGGIEFPGEPEIADASAVLSKLARVA